MHAPPSGRARLRFGRYDYAAFLFFAAYAASSLAIPVVLVDMAEDLRFPLLEGSANCRRPLYPGRCSASADH